MEVELREQVASSFAGKHLKSLLNDKVFNHFRKEVSAQVDEEIAKNVATMKRDGWRTRVHLDTKIREAIRDSVEKAAKAAFGDEMVREYVDKEARRVKADVDYKIDRAIKRAISKEKLGEVVAARVQELLTTAANLADCAAGGKQERVINVD